MPAAMKGAISFGLLHVPISLHTATQDNDISFHQLYQEDGSRVRYKKVCAGCGKEVSGDDIVKGFEIEPGRYRIALETKRHPTVFIAFDCLYYDGCDLMMRPPLERKEYLRQAVSDSECLAVSRIYGADQA